MTKLTDKAIANAKPKDRDYYLSDSDGLRVRIKSSGVKLFELRYYFAGKRLALGFGTYPETRLKTARKRAFDSRCQLEAGIDPKAERARLDAERQANALEKTVEGLYHDWMQSYIIPYRKRPEQVKEFLQADVLRFIGKIKANSVRKAHLVALIEKIVQRGALVKADKVLSLVKQMFAHGVAKGLVEANPAQALQKRHFGIKPSHNQRYFTETEIRELFRQLPVSGLPERTQWVVILLLATAQRTGELRKARWQEIDFNNRLWTIPAEHSKNGKPHKVHLSAFALHYFERLQRTATSDLVIESPRLSGQPLEEKTLTKQIRDRQRTIPLNNRTGKTESLLLSNGEWSLHDLRHTAHTGMGGLGIAPYVIEKILNHTLPGIMAVYNHQEYLSEREKALELWGEYLDRLQNADLSNVIELRKTTSSKGIQ